jgi:hypothetical protein
MDSEKRVFYIAHFARNSAVASARLARITEHSIAPELLDFLSRRRA